MQTLWKLADVDSNISLPSKRKRTSARRWLPPILLPVFIVIAFVWRAFDVERSRDAYGPVGRSVAPAPAHYEELDFNFGAVTSARAGSSISTNPMPEPGAKIIGTGLKWRWSPRLRGRAKPSI